MELSLSLPTAVLLLGAVPQATGGACSDLLTAETSQHGNAPVVAEPLVVAVPSPSRAIDEGGEAQGGSPSGEIDGTPPDALSPEPGDIVVTARGEPPPGDPLQNINATSFRIAGAVDRAFVGPVAHGYEKVIPEPVRDGLGNALRNLGEPVNFLNFLLQFKLGKAAETLGRFALNSTIGIGGLFDVAKKKPFNLPYRPNGFANTLGFYGVEPGTYFYLPLVGPTTLRDMAGDTVDLLVLPVSIGKPFDRAAFSLPATAIEKLNDRVTRDAEISRLREMSGDPYAETRMLYLDMRQREIEALKGTRPLIPLTEDAIVPPLGAAAGTSAGTGSRVDAHAGGTVPARRDDSC